MYKTNKNDTQLDNHMLNKHNKKTCRHLGMYQHLCIKKYEKHIMKTFNANFFFFNENNIGHLKNIYI